MLEFFRTIADWLGADRYAAHSICLSNDPWIIAPFLVGDIVIALSYFVMGTAFIIYRTKIIRMSPTVRGLWGAFVVLCALSHVAKSLTLFVGMYRLEVIVIMITAGVSAATAWITVQQIGDWTD